MPEDNKEDGEKEEEEEELYEGDYVRLSNSMTEVQRLLQEVGIGWDQAMAQYLGQVGQVRKIDVKDEKQIIHVQFNGTDGPTHTHSAKALEYLPDHEGEENEAPEIELASDEEEEDEPNKIWRIGEKIKELVRARKGGKIPTGMITQVGDGKCDIKFDDGTTQAGVPMGQLRALEKPAKDGSGFTCTATYNEYDFTKSGLPSGVEAIGEGVELRPGRGGETYLFVRKGTYLKMPLKGLRHERLKSDEPIPSYTMTLELQLAESHKNREAPWSIFQASFPEQHETDEVCITAVRKPDHPKWKVGTDVDKLLVCAEIDPTSNQLAELTPGTIVQQCGDIQRLPSGARRVPVKFKRSDISKDEDGKPKENKEKEEAEEDADIQEALGFRGGGAGEDEVVITLFWGYWGKKPGEVPTSIKVTSNEITKTISFHPGTEGGKFHIDGQKEADVGWTPCADHYHILTLTMKATGSHSIELLDGKDPTKVFKTDFRSTGWFDDVYGSAGIKIADPEEHELEDPGAEISYKAEGDHKFKLVKIGDREFETDELDPQGWVNFNRASLEPLEQGPKKAQRGPSCHVKVKETLTEKRLVPGRWHSLTFTVDGDEDKMTIYIDGELAVKEEIDLFDYDMDFGKMRRDRAGGGGGRGEGGGRRGGLQHSGGGGGGGDLSSLMWFGGGGTPNYSRFRVPQEGFLLFASNSMRSMPGDVKVRKAVFRNFTLDQALIEQQYVKSRHRKRPKDIPKELSLTPLMKRKAQAIWSTATFMSELCNPFVPAIGGDVLKMYQTFVFTLEGTIQNLEKDKWPSEEIQGMRLVLDLYKAADPLYKKWQQLWAAEEPDQKASLSTVYLRRLEASRSSLALGGRFIMPLGLQLGRNPKEWQLLMLIVEKKLNGCYRFVVVNPSTIGLGWHEANAGAPPKIKYRTGMEFDDVEASVAEDEAWWAMLVITSVTPIEASTLYDKLLPWLAKAPLEHKLSNQPLDTTGAAVMEWRTPQQAKTDTWRHLTFAFRFLLREVAKVSHSRSKILKWQLRRQMLSFASFDLTKVTSLSVSERRLLRLGLAQLAHSAVKISGLPVEDSGEKDSVPLLRDTHEFIKDVEKTIDTKPRPYGFDDPSVLPVMDLNAGSDEAPQEEWGMFPFFDRLLKEAKSPGQKVGIPLLVPIDLLAMPEKIADLEDAIGALRLCEELCGKLSFVGQERCKFAPFLKVALLQHVFSELVPLPIAPSAQKPPLSLVDAIWAPNGFDGLHPQMTRATQLDLLMLLRRLCEQFVAAICSVKSSKGFDGVKIVILGAIAAITDRVLRTRVRRLGACEPEERPSQVTELLNGIGPDKNWRPLAVDATSFLVQSETIEVASPELNIARTAVASYFSDMVTVLGVKTGADETIFDWDTNGWMMWVDKEKGCKRFIKALCASHLLDCGDQWSLFLAGQHPYACHVWHDFECYRDVIFWWKYFLCTDLRVFPEHAIYEPHAAFAVWSCKDEQEAYQSPPNRAQVFAIKAMGKDHMTFHREMGNRPKPPTSGLRWPSAALPSNYTKTPVRTEDDLLYMRALPSFDETLRAADAEALLSFMTVPYIRMPLTMAFFTTGDRVNSLFNETLQGILQAVVLEPGRLLEPKRWTDAPTTVPATTKEELELIATPYGQLLTELACAPACLCAYVAKMVELALVLANSAMSQTVNLILFVTRIAARVESAINLLLMHSEGKLSSGPLPGSLPSSAANLHDLKQAKKLLRKQFIEVEGWLAAWLGELQDLAQKAIKEAQEKAAMGGITAKAAKQAKESAQTQVDEYMRKSCNMHAHVLLILRNITEDDLDEDAVTRMLSSLAFLSLHHTFNADYLDFPEPELFEIYHHHRRGLVRWFEKQQKAREYKLFNNVLQTVHKQFATIDTSSADDTSKYEWGAIGGDVHNAGRFCIVGPIRTDAERGDVAIAKPDEAGWVELNIQLMQVTVRGRHVTPLEADTAENTDFAVVMNLGENNKADTMQCAALLSTSIVRVRELLSQPFRVTRWEALTATDLPFIGDYCRLYDVEDMEEWETWIPKLFEPIRTQFFVAPVCGPQDILFFLREETHPDATVVVIAGVHPKIRGKIWKEVMIFRDLRMVQVYKIEAYGHQLYRLLEYTTDCRYCMCQMQPDIKDRNNTWPEWGRYEAGGPKLQPEDHPPSAVMTRNIVRDTQGEGNAGGGDRRSDPLDDDDQWSEGEPSDDETEAEKAERTVWEKSQREGEQYIPPRYMAGLLPDAILQKYRIYQENEPPCRMARGYPLTTEGEEEAEPDHLLEIKLIKVNQVPACRLRGWCAMVRKRYRQSSRKPMYLLNLLYAREGTPLHSLARTLVRLEDLAHILAWTESDPRAQSTNPTIDFVEMPRLQATFASKISVDTGVRRLWSLDHAELSIPSGPHTKARTQASKLLGPMPHAVLLETKNEELFTLVPNVLAHRPYVGSDPFSTELVLERGSKDWNSVTVNKTFLYPIHSSNSFLQAPTRAAALYLMKLRWMNRDYGGVSSLVSAVGTDTKYEENEMIIFKTLGVINDPHPDSHANRMKVSLAVADAGMRWPWDVLAEAAGYIRKNSHVSARSRITMKEEDRILELCTEIRRTIEIVTEEVKTLQARFWGQWGAARLNRYKEIISNAAAEKTASYQEVREIHYWIRALLRKMRAMQLPGTQEDVKHWVLLAFENYKVPKSVILQLDNRIAYLARMMGLDSGEGDLQLACPKRPEQTFWMCWTDHNIFASSLFDLCYDVLGPEATLRRDAEEEEGPEIPAVRRFPLMTALQMTLDVIQGKLSLQDFGSKATTFALFYSLFTKSVSVRLSRARETKPEHQHTFTTFLLHVMPGSRFNDYLASMLHKMCYNPQFCEAMPSLTKPKKTRLVKQWKEKLTEMRTAIIKGEDSQQLADPPYPEMFQELPEPIMSTVVPERLVMPPQGRGLCPRLLFCPEIPRIGASVWGCPKLQGLSCDNRVLMETPQCTQKDISTFATKPLAALLDEYLLELPPTTKMDGAMPFRLDKHVLAQHRVAVGMFQKLDREMQFCAEMRNARKTPSLKGLTPEDIKSVVSGDAASLAKAKEQVIGVIKKLLEMKAADVTFTADAIHEVQATSNEIDTTDAGGGDPLHKLRFWLLRYADLESSVWFEHMCCGLLSPTCEADFQEINPFLSSDISKAMLNRTSQMMLTANRIVQECRALDTCHDLLKLLDKPESMGSKEALLAGITEKSNLVCSWLSTQRTFIKEGNAFDPRFLIFEFVTSFVLRPRQIAMIEEFLGTVKEQQSVVKQMIMGAGKTSVISPLLTLMLANGERLVCLVVPQALLVLSRSVLQNCFSTVVQKCISTFKCDRSTDLTVNLAARIARVCKQGDVMLTTPGDVKSLQLRFLEQLDLSNDRMSKKNNATTKRECVDMGQMLRILKEGVCLIDEVDLVLHPLRSELNFPIGAKNPIDHHPVRWNIVLHLLDGFFAINGVVPPALKDNLRAKQALKKLSDTLREGTDKDCLQQSPHLVLLDEEFYHKQMKPVMCEWLSIWLSAEHVGQVFEKESEVGDRGLSEDEVRAYILYRDKSIKLIAEATAAEWQAALARATMGEWLLELVQGKKESGTGMVEMQSHDLPCGSIARAEYQAELSKVPLEGKVRIVLTETKESVGNRMTRVERLPPKDVKSMNQCVDWLQVFLPFCLRKIDRVTFGIMTADQVTQALREQPLMPLTRAKLAIPFIGKDVPSTSSEFAHPDVVIGLTVLAYRYEGLRRGDFDEVLSMLSEKLESENGSMMERPTSTLWKQWVEESGAVFCVKQAELDEQTAEDILETDANESTAADRSKARVLPLHLLERRNESNMNMLFNLMRKLPSAVHYYLREEIFPQFMRFQDEKLSASGQDLGGSMLFGQRIGFSGTPSELMPEELGECGYEKGSEGEMVRCMTDPDVCSFKAVPRGWSVESILDMFIAAAQEGVCNALIDTGALITGFTNREVSEYLLGFGKFRPLDAASKPALPEAIDGVVYLDEDGSKLIMLRQTREPTKLADSGVPAQRRFAFYDQVHTTGMDIQHKLDATAALTLGKDMNWRDYVQGAYRMRGISRGQRICLYVIPEVVELITKDLQAAEIEKQLAAEGGNTGPWTESTTGRLRGVAAWLLVNSIRTERVQFAMLQLQNLNNVGRKSAFSIVMRDFERVTTELLKTSVKVFKESIAFVLPEKVPRPRGVHEVVEERIEIMKDWIWDKDGNVIDPGQDPTIHKIRENVKIIAKLGDEKENEAGLDTEQQREQEQERQQEQEQEEEREQEIEIEKFVDLMHCRDDEEPDSWELKTLGDDKATQFYGAGQFRLWKRKPLSNLTPESRLSRNWFNPQWSGFRRVKNVFVQMEWTADLKVTKRCTDPLDLDDEEMAEMHRKLRNVWDLLIRGEGREATPSLIRCASDEKPHGNIDGQKIKELLAAAFDWEPSLTDPSAALAALGKKKDESIGYDQMVDMLIDARYRTRDEGRQFVLLSLAEAETLRRVLHGRVDKPLLESSPNAAIALRCVFANHEVMDSSTGFEAGPPFQVRMLHQLARFLDGQTFYRPSELSVLLRAVQRTRPADRRRFLEGLGGCRRRAGLASWDSQPVAEVLRPWLEFEQVLTRIRAVRLYTAITSQGNSVQNAFKQFDQNNSGTLEPMEFCRALRELGFAFDAGEVANWIEAIDSNDDYCIDYSEFFTFCKTQAEALLGPGGHLVAAPDIVKSSTKRTVATGLAPPATFSRQVSVKSSDKKPHPIIPEDAAIKLVPPTLGQADRATSLMVQEKDIEEELKVRRMKLRQAETEEEKAKAKEEEDIDILIEEELGMNPKYGDGYGEWDFRGTLLPKETFSLGVVEIVPEVIKAVKGTNYLLMDRRAGLAIQHMMLTPNGDSDRRINRYSLTVWFRTPTLPSKADRMLLADIPRGDADPDAYDDAKTGAIFIWRNGVIAPENYENPNMRRAKTGGTSGVDTVPGEWKLTFEGESGEKTHEVKLAVEPSGRMSIQPLRGAGARQRDSGTTANIYAVKLNCKAERQNILDTQFMGVMPDYVDSVLDQFWHANVIQACSVLMSQFARPNWKDLGWKLDYYGFYQRSKKVVKTSGEFIICRGVDLKTAMQMVKAVEGYTKGGADFVEDHSMELEPGTGDKVKLVRGAPCEEKGLKPSDVAKVTSLNQYSEEPYLLEWDEGKQCGWFAEAWIRKLTPKELGLEPLTDAEWLALPSTRSNYVSASEQKPNPFFESVPWTAKGRADGVAEGAVEAKVMFDTATEGSLQSYVNATVGYDAGGSIVLNGEWRAGDGTKGAITGKKALTSVAISGIWHVELQCGAESMEHAWNCWFSSCPSSEGSGIRVSGAAIAGPMLSKEGEEIGRLDLTGAMVGKGALKFTIAEGTNRWSGSVWEGELGDDRWLRGSWETGPNAAEKNSGRWRARHIGRQSVASALKPLCEEDMEWTIKDSSVTTSVSASGMPERPKVGDKVRLVKNYRSSPHLAANVRDNERVLKPGQIGELIQDDFDSRPFYVRGPDGCTDYYIEGTIQIVKPGEQKDGGVKNPLGDQFEGITFSRFPVKQGQWYAEVQVSRLGRTQPFIGWCIGKEGKGKMEFVRMFMVEGKTARKMDITKRKKTKKKTEDGKAAEETPADGEAPPVETGEAPPAEGEEKPAEGETPAEGEKKPAEGEEKPPEGEEKVADGEEKAAGGEEKPAEGEDKPAEGEAKPAEGEEKPAEGEEKPAEGEDKPAEGEEKPAEGEEKPAEGEEKPAEGEEAPPPEVPPEQPQEEPEEDEDADKWGKHGTPFGHTWMEGDTICVAADITGGKLSFGLNGEYTDPMGEGFTFELPEGHVLYMVTGPGDDGRLRVNMGQTAFANPPPSSEYRGLGEAMFLRPILQVALPEKEKITVWPVFAGKGSTEGRKALKNKDIVEQIELSDGWVRHERGWSPWKRTVNNKDIEAFEPTPVWKSIDRGEKPKKEKKVLKRTTNASFDIENGQQNNWTFKGVDQATCNSGPTMLLSNESVATGVIKWCLKIEDGQPAFEVGVIPASQTSDPQFLHNSGDVGLKSKDCGGAEQLSTFDLYKKYVEVTADMTDRKMKIRVGEEREHMVEAKAMDIPYEEDVRLAVTGNQSFICTLQQPMLKLKADEDEESDEEEDEDGLQILTCGNAVQANTWHVATIVADLPVGEMRITLDGEEHLTVRDTNGLLPDGPLAIDPKVGLHLFGSTRRIAGLVGDTDWRAGGHLRSLRIDAAALDQFDIWSQHTPKGIWGCQCGARNAADGRVCWKCRTPRQKTGTRPPGDMDPRHEGLTVITAESFRELVLESTTHVFIAASAPWCGACKALKPMWIQLAKALSAEPKIVIATIDVDENELPSKYFPETHIPVIKLFAAGKKRQPIIYRLDRSFEAFAYFLEQHTGISIKSAIEAGYPDYKEKKGLADFFESMKQAAMTAPLQRVLGRTPMQGLAAFLYSHLTDPIHDPTPVQAPAATESEAPKLLRLVSTGGQRAAPPSLRRSKSSYGGAGAVAAPNLKRHISGAGGADMRQMLGVLDPGAKKRLCADLVDKQLEEQLRGLQPEDPKKFAKQFFLQIGTPVYSHKNFYNARRGATWQITPSAIKLVAAARILRFVMRWTRSRGAELGLQTWAPAQIFEMTGAAHRHNWRRVEAAICNDDQAGAVPDLQQLLERGYNVNQAPYGTTPLALACAVGNLPAAQFLFVRGANAHKEAGRPPAIPVEIAAGHGHLSIVQLLIENGSFVGKSLHFAAAGGHMSIAKFLMAHNASPDLCVKGVSALAVALLSGQHRVANKLLPSCRPEALAKPMPDKGCRAAGMPEGSTMLHLAGSLGGLREGIVLELARDPALVAVRNKNNDLAFDLMAPTLKCIVQPKYFSAFTVLEGLGETDPCSRIEPLLAAFGEGANVAALDVRNFTLLDVASFCGLTKLVEALLGAMAPLVSRGNSNPSALMWAHWGNHEDCVVQLSVRGASLSNADLEGLQRLRTAMKGQEPVTEEEPPRTTSVDSKKAAPATPSTPLKPASGADKKKDDKKDEKDPGCPELLKPNPIFLFDACSPSGGYLTSAKGMIARMSWGIGAKVGTTSGHISDKSDAPHGGVFLKAAKSCCSEGPLARSQLFALRRIAEGSGLVVSDLIALHLFLVDPGFHSSLCECWTTLAAYGAPAQDTDRALELQGAHAQLAHALKAVPAKKGLSYRACKITTDSGTLREVLHGHRHGLDSYRPGSIVLWRHAASATTDPSLAEEVALRGDSGCGVIFKVRRSLGARPMAEFAEHPQQGEVVFPPGSTFRVVGLFPCSERVLSRGGGSDSPWSCDVGFTVQHSESLTFEDACRSRNVVVVLDEEGAGALAKEGGFPS